MREELNCMVGAGWKQAELVKLSFWAAFLHMKSSHLDWKKVYRGLNSVVIHPTHPIIPSISYNINHRMSWRFARCAFDETSRFRAIRHLLTRRIAWKCRAHVFGAYSTTNFWCSGSVTKKLFTNVLGFLILSMTHECIKNKHAGRLVTENKHFAALFRCCKLQHLHIPCKQGKKQKEKLLAKSANLFIDWNILK